MSAGISASNLGIWCVHSECRLYLICMWTLPNCSFVVTGLALTSGQYQHQVWLWSELFNSAGSQNCSMGLSVRRLCWVRQKINVVSPRKILCSTCCVQSCIILQHEVIWMMLEAWHDMRLQNLIIVMLDMWEPWILCLCYKNNTY